MKMIDKKEDKVNNKIVYTFEYEHVKQKTPDRKLILEVAMKELRVDKKLMIIKQVKTTYGTNNSLVTIHVYKTREDLEKNEPKHLVKRVTFKEEEKVEEKPAEEAKEEPAKTEETKEEVKE